MREIIQLGEIEFFLFFYFKKKNPFRLRKVLL